MTTEREARLQASIDRLSFELAQERAEHRRTTEALESARRRAAAWRRVAEWIHAAKKPPPNEE